MPSANFSTDSGSQQIVFRILTHSATNAYYIYEMLLFYFSDTEIKLFDDEIPEIPLPAYDFNSTKKILFFTSFYEWKNFTFGLGNIPFVQV